MAPRSHNVVELRRKPEDREPHMWECNCGCITFYLYDDLRLQCAHCKTWQNGNPIPPPPDPNVGGYEGREDQRSLPRR